MDQVNNLEKSLSASKFEDVIVVQPNGEKVMQSKCKNCNIITMKNDFSIWRHW